MTLEKLLNCRASELKALTPAQLEEYFKPVLHITRPDLATKPTASAKTGLPSTTHQKADAVAQMLKGMGIDI